MNYGDGLDQRRGGPRDAAFHTSRPCCPSVVRRVLGRLCGRHGMEPPRTQEPQGADGQLSRGVDAAQVIGLAMIRVYAFFKFAWSYRLFNYVAILFGATPLAAEQDEPEARAHAIRTARLFTAAGRHFNRGQRAFFFALAYLGWFVSPWVLMATTAAAVIVMWARQFASDARRAVVGNE